MALNFVEWGNDPSAPILDLTKSCCCNLGSKKRTSLDWGTTIMDHMINMAASSLQPVCLQCPGVPVAHGYSLFREISFFPYSAVIKKVFLRCICVGGIRGLELSMQNL